MGRPPVWWRCLGSTPRTEVFLSRRMHGRPHGRRLLVQRVLAERPVVIIMHVYDSCMSEKKQPITITLPPDLRRYAEDLVQAGKAASISAVISEALSEKANRDRRALAAVRAKAAQANKERVARMRAHIEAQAAALGFRDAPGE
jgi:Arc/MetJ-type ribon-helix-helix transcriptional regulator